MRTFGEKVGKQIDRVSYVKGVVSIGISSLKARERLWLSKEVTKQGNCVCHVYSAVSICVSPSERLHMRGKVSAKGILDRQFFAVAEPEKDLVPGFAAHGDFFFSTRPGRGKVTYCHNPPFLPKQGYRCPESDIKLCVAVRIQGNPQVENRSPSRIRNGEQKTPATPNLLECGVSFLSCGKVAGDSLARGKFYLTAARLPTEKACERFTCEVNRADEVFGGDTVGQATFSKATVSSNEQIAKKFAVFRQAYWPVCAYG